MHEALRVCEVVARAFMRSKGIDGFIRFRRALEKLITWRGVFDHFILACILTNCLFLALSDPSASPLYAHDEIWNAVLFVGDLAFTAIFCVEMLLKLLVYGVAFHPKAYLRSVWNWLDMLVVVFSVLGRHAAGTWGERRRRRSSETRGCGDVLPSLFEVFSWFELV